MTGSREYLTTDTYDSVVGWYENKLGSRGDLVGATILDEYATWVYEPSRYDNGIMVVVTNGKSGTRIKASTYVK